MQTKQPLRIATVVTGSFTTPQPLGITYAPIDLATALTAGLTSRGHKVSYFAPEGSQLLSGLLETCELPPLKQASAAKIVMETVTDKYEHGRIEQLWTQALIAQMFRRAEEGEYDILHVHPITACMPFAIAHPNVPVIYTLHDPISVWRRMVYHQLQSKNQWFVSISDSQRKPAPNLQYAATVYNGVDPALFPFAERAGDYLLFIGRIHPNKGILQAIKVAQMTGEKLVIIGQIGAEWQIFWDKEIKPHLNEKITYAGFVDRALLYTYYQKAKAFLMPIQWEEPFGLVMTEAMSCGTPVVAFGRGSVPEVVVNGQTGFIVDTVEEMVAAVGKINEIDRATCRRHVEQNFSMEKMVNDYETAYYSILT